MIDTVDYSIDDLTESLSRDSRIEQTFQELFPLVIQCWYMVNEYE